MKLGTGRSLPVALRRVLQGFADLRVGREGISLREPEECDPRLRIPSGLARSEEGILGTLQVPHPKADRPQLAERPSRDGSGERTNLFARSASLAFGIVPRAPEPQDLGAVHATHPLEGAERTVRGPLLHRLGPLIGPVVLGERLEGTDRAAEQDHRGHPVQLARHRGDRRLVQERQPLLDLSEQDQRASLRVGGERARRRIAGAVRDLDRPSSFLERRFPVAGVDQGRPCHLDGQGRVHRRVGEVRQQVPASHHPTPERGLEAFVEEDVRDPRGGGGGALPVAFRQPRRVHALPRVARDSRFADEIGDLRAHRDAVGVQLPRPVGFREQVVCLLPCLAGDGVSGSCYGFLIPKLGHGRSPGRSVNHSAGLHGGEPRV